MKWFVLLSLGLIFLTGEGWGDEVSLIDPEEMDENILNTQINQVEEGLEDAERNEDESQSNDYEQINDFIQEEDQKIKDIRLLNLDLERSSLELKRREVEQKISQLNKSEGMMLASFQDNRDGERSMIKLVGIFESSHKKEAILNMNGVNTKVTEGQVLNRMAVKSISDHAVIIEYDDGDIQEIYL